MKPAVLLVAALVGATVVGAAPGEARAAKTRSVGFYSNGSLEQGLPLEAEGPDHYLLYRGHCYRKLPMAAAYPDAERADNFYAHPSVLDAVRDVARAVRRRHPDAPRLPVGELAHVDGGKIPFHNSHRNGLDVDIFFLLRPRSWTPPGGLARDPALSIPVCQDGPWVEERDPETGAWHVTADFDRAWNWSLVAAFAARDDVKTIFAGRLIRRELRRWARRTGVPRAERERTLARLSTPFCRPGPTRPGRGVSGNFCPHADHIHVRFHCPTDSPECRERR